MQDPNSSQPTDVQTDIESVIHQDELQTVPLDLAVTRATNGSSDKANGRAKVPATNGNGNGKQSNYRLNNASGLTIERRYTKLGEDVYSTVEWELRDAVISNERGEKVFEQIGCEIPKSWTQLATNVVVSKYFRGHIGTPEREHSVRQLIGRVADTIANWGRKMDYFATETDAQAFQDELTHILLHQKAAFNSPVWFNVGLADQPVPQVSACQPYHARVLTTKGPMTIGQIVDQKQIGLSVFDGNGATEVVAVKHNGRKPVFRIELTDGFVVEATADHLVCAHEERRIKTLQWQRVDQLAVGMKMRVYPHAARTYVAPTSALEISEAALAGWLQADGFVGQYLTGTNKSLTIEFLTNGEEEHKWVMDHLQVVFPHAHLKVRDVETLNADVPLRRVRLYGEHLRPFITKYELLRRGLDIRVPAAIWTASEEAALAYLASVYQAEGYVSSNSSATHVGMAVISEGWAREIQVLLTRVGIYARRMSKEEKREDRHNLHVLDIAILSERAKFAQCIGFISEAKSSKLLASLTCKGKRCPDIRYSAIKSIQPLGEMDVYDIQTRSGQYLSEGVLVHNCFINSVDDTMESILTLAKTEGMLFKFGSGTGTNLSTIRGSNEPLKGGGTASGPLSFMRGFDQFAGAIKCLTPDAYVYTEQGMQTLGEVIDTSQSPGFHPNDSVVLATKDGPTRISHVYVSPEADTYRLRLSRTNLTLRGTAEHPVLTLTPDFQLAWKRLTDLIPGERVAVSRRAEMWPLDAPSFADFKPRTEYAKKTLSYPTQMTPELARLLGYMVSEGCMDEERFRFCNADEDVFDDFLACVRSVFGVAPVRNISQRVNPQTGVATWLFEACWTNAIRFLKHVGLTTAQSNAKTVPWGIRCAPRPLVVEFLRAYFEGDGHVSTHVYAASASESLLREIQLLLLNMGMVALLRPHPVNGKDYWSLYLRGEQAWMFVREVGFVSARKRGAAQFAGDKNTNIDTIPFLADVLRTRAEGSYFRCEDGANRRLAFNFFNRKAGIHLSYNQLRNTPGLVDKVRTISSEWGATLETILAGEFFWDTVADVEATERAITYDFTVPGTHSFIANGIVNHNSGGKTRRAAKMALLDISHPDIENFITSKAEEEKKAHALIDAGYSGMFNVPGGAYDSVQFQNANHSVRVTDEFMETYLKNGEWSTRNVMDKKVNKTYKASDLMNKIGASAWVCGDPGMQYDTTINKWHTCKNTQRIYASNPCCITGDTLVAVADGRNAVAIKDLVGSEVPVYAHDHGTGRTTIARMWNIGVKRANTAIYRVTLDDGSNFRVTDDHLIMQRDGSYRMVRDLKTGDSLMPFHSKVLAPAQNRTKRRFTWSGQSWQPQYRALWQYAHGVQPEGCHIHHRDFNALNDLLDNLQLMTAEEHNALHGDKMRGDNNPARRMMNDAWRHNIGEAVRGEKNGNYGRVHSEQTRQQMRQKSAQRWADPNERTRSGESVRKALAKAAAEGQTLGRPRGERFDRCCPVCRANYTTSRVEQIFCSLACRYSPMGLQMSGQKTAAQNRGGHYRTRIAPS